MSFQKDKSYVRLYFKRYLSCNYFYGYKSDIFSFQNNPKNQDLSYKTDLVFWGLFRKGKTHIIAKFLRTDSVICSHSREGKPCLIAK